ncbi:MAG: transposase [Pseudomonadota bacterium]
MTAEFGRLFDQTRPAFGQDRTFARAKTLATSALVGLGRRTVSGMLCTSAQQFDDWSAAYRLFEQERFSREGLFAPVLGGVLERLESRQPLVAMMDDTLMRKRGRKVHGTGWRRDPLGPPFTTNFVWGQRFLQISAALPAAPMGPARGVPLDLVHAPPAPRPRKAASAESWKEYRRQQESMKISAVGVQRLIALRHRLDKETNGKDRLLVMPVDGGFTNRSVFRCPPPNTILIGRIRKDARLFSPVPPQARRGRPRWFGAPLPTPEQTRQDDSISWSRVEAFAAGKLHSFEVKTVTPVRWSGTGARNVRLVVISPLAYRPHKGAKLLYRDPAYLICTDPGLPLSQLLQAYLWRWEVELNFRDEKTLLGVGEAQVRTQAAVEAVPALIVAAYAFLLLAGTASGVSSALPPPKWRSPNTLRRGSTAHLIGTLRSQLWGKAMGLNLSHFVSPKQPTTNTDLFKDSLPSAVCYAFN